MTTNLTPEECHHLVSIATAQQLSDLQMQKPAEYREIVRQASAYEPGDADGLVWAPAPDGIVSAKTWDSLGAGELSLLEQNDPEVYAASLRYWIGNDLRISPPDPDEDDGDDGDDDGDAQHALDHGGAAVDSQIAPRDAGALMRQFHDRHVVIGDSDLNRNEF